MGRGSAHDGADCLFKDLALRRCLNKVKERDVSHVTGQRVHWTVPTAGQKPRTQIGCESNREAHAVGAPKAPGKGV